MANHAYGQKTGKQDNQLTFSPPVDDVEEQQKAHRPCRRARSVDGGDRH
jgi:hypothetical protein